MHFAKNAKSALMAMLITGSLIVSVSASERTIAITGTVLDSATNQPVPQAMVFFFATASITADSSSLSNILNGNNMDTTYSGTDGAFSYHLNTGTDSRIFLAGILLQGYKFAYKLKLITSTTLTLNLDTIKISKNLGLTNDTLMVSGTIVDSATGNPLGNCSILMSGKGTMDTAGNTAVSGSDGTFSHRVIIDTSSYKSIDYIIKMDGYQTVYGKMDVASKQVDLGTIKVAKKSGVGIVPGIKPVNQIRQAVAIKSYSLNGRLLTSGASLATAKQQLHSSGIAIILLTNNKKCLLTRKNIVLQ